MTSIDNLIKKPEFINSANRIARGVLHEARKMMKEANLGRTPRVLPVRYRATMSLAFDPDKVTLTTNRVKIGDTVLDQPKKVTVHPEQIVLDFNRYLDHHGRQAVKEGLHEQTERGQLKQMLVTNTIATHAVQYGLPELTPEQASELAYPAMWRYLGRKKNLKKGFWNLF